MRAAFALHVPGDFDGAAPVPSVAQSAAPSAVASFAGAQRTIEREACLAQHPNEQDDKRIGEVDPLGRVSFTITRRS